MKVRTALIGYTGFVGSNLDATGVRRPLQLEEHRRDRRPLVRPRRLHSGNRADLAPDQRRTGPSLAEIDGLADIPGDRHDRLARAHLHGVPCARSAVAGEKLLPGAAHPTRKTPLSPEGLTPYGANRLHQEAAAGRGVRPAAARAPPQLYGARCARASCTTSRTTTGSSIDPTMPFQHYDARRLWATSGRRWRRHPVAQHRDSPDLQRRSRGRGVRARHPQPGAAGRAVAVRADVDTQHDHAPRGAVRGLGSASTSARSPTRSTAFGLRGEHRRLTKDTMHQRTPRLSPSSTAPEGGPASAATSCW